MDKFIITKWFLPLFFPYKAIPPQNTQFQAKKSYGIRFFNVKYTSVDPGKTHKKKNQENIYKKKVISN